MACALEAGQNIDLCMRQESLLTSLRCMCYKFEIMTATNTVTDQAGSVYRRQKDQFAAHMIATTVAFLGMLIVWSVQSTVQ